MIEKLIGLSFFPVDGMKEIRKGDIFRMSDDGFSGPALVATADAEQRPSRNNPEKLVWYVAVD